MLTRYFNTSASVWLRLQVRYDLELAEQQFGDQINKKVHVLHQQLGVE
jgi:plasmid maintenance system antidote protein VapI